MRANMVDLARLATVAEAVPEGVPIVMLNLLRYRDQADYGDRTDVTPCSGRTAFQERYVAHLLPLMPAGARMSWAGAAMAGLIGPPDERWDEVALVEYPSLDAFRAMIEDPRYEGEAAPYRFAALADSRLIITVPIA